MALIAVYSAKGGVGKTSIAVNLGWAAATLSSRRTLLWDLDAQAAATHILAPAGHRGGRARDVIVRDIAPEAVVIATAIAGLDLLPADASLRSPDLLFAEVDAKKRLRRIGETLLRRYDRVIVDCPPGLGPTADQLLRAADLIVLPTIPAPLSAHADAALAAHIRGRRRPGAPLLPVYNLVDRRRAAHRAAIAAEPERPAIPMASAIERMAEAHAPVATYAPNGAAAAAVAALWRIVEQRLAG